MEQPLYDYLRGKWSVKRQIEDRLAKQDHCFTGNAGFSGIGVDLEYKETGHLEIGETVMAAERCYFWRCGVARASVYFDHDRKFHDLTLNGGSADALHHCGEDTYRGNYRFHSGDAWDVVWFVSGPRKQYVSVTRYHRALSGLQ